MMNSSRNSFEMVCCSRFIILQSVVARYLFVQKVVNCCLFSKEDVFGYSKNYTRNKNEILDADHRAAPAEWLNGEGVLCAAGYPYQAVLLLAT